MVNDHSPNVHNKRGDGDAGRNLAVPIIYLHQSLPSTTRFMVPINYLY
jgi:hypothetical protein